MFEFRVGQLKKGDEFTADNGDSWWKVLGKDGCDIECECLSTQISIHRVGERDSFWFLPGDRVIVR